VGSENCPRSLDLRRCALGWQMSNPFSRSLRSLHSDSFRLSILFLVLAAMLLAAWTAWFFFAKVSIYAISDRADLEVDRAAHPVASQFTGRVVATHLVLGREVAAQALRLREERIQLLAYRPQLAALQNEMSAEEKAVRAEQQAAVVALDEARARHREAETSARFAEGEAVRVQKMFAAGVISELDLRKARSEAQSRRAAADSLHFAVTRQEKEQHTRSSDREAHIQQLRSELNQLRGQESTAAATVGRLENEVELRRIRAPVDGTLADVASLKIGAVLREGETVGVVVPAGKLRVVASFLPPAALGRIHRGQPARLRLEGFPWVQFGSVAASVTTVASEIRDDHIRVELAMDSSPKPRISLQHGLPGSVEVEVERISPATLVLRMAGRYLTESRTNAPAIRRQP
jgi:multidrug resistance efflux pump